MRQSSEQHFSTGLDPSEADALRRLLEETEPADVFDKRTCERVGSVLARAAYHSRGSQAGGFTGF
jgi:hypothetical protein